MLTPHAWNIARRLPRASTMAVGALTLPGPKASRLRPASLLKPLFVPLADDDPTH